VKFVFTASSDEVKPGYLPFHVIPRLLEGKNRFAFGMRFLGYPYRSYTVLRYVTTCAETVTRMANSCPVCCKRISKFNSP